MAPHDSRRSKGDSHFLADGASLGEPSKRRASPGEPGQHVEMPDTTPPPSPRQPPRHAPRCCCTHLPQPSFEVMTSKSTGEKEVKTSSPAHEQDARSCRAGHNRPTP